MDLALALQKNILKDQNLTEVPLVVDLVVYPVDVHGQVEVLHRLLPQQLVSQG